MIPHILDQYLFAQKVEELKVGPKGIPGNKLTLELLTNRMFEMINTYDYFSNAVELAVTGEYYRNNMFGLKAAGWGEILPVQFLRSLLFFLAYLPIIVTWRKSRQSMFIILGAGQFILVGFLYMLMSYWLPLFVRIPHSIEILADSFVHVGLLMWLLAKQFPFLHKKAVGA